MLPGPSAVPRRAFPVRTLGVGNSLAPDSRPAGAAARAAVRSALRSAGARPGARGRAGSRAVRLALAGHRGAAAPGGDQARAARQGVGSIAGRVSPPARGHRSLARRARASGPGRGGVHRGRAAAGAARRSALLAAQDGERGRDVRGGERAHRRPLRAALLDARRGLRLRRDPLRHPGRARARAQGPDPARRRAPGGRAGGVAADWPARAPGRAGPGRVVGARRSRRGPHPARDAAVPGPRPGARLPTRGIWEKPTAR